MVYLKMKKIHKSIYLSASKSDLYKWLFDDTYVSQYMGCHIKKVNDTTYHWYHYKDENELLLLTGEIIDFKENEYITIKTFNPHRNYQKPLSLLVTYSLKERHEETELTIVQTGFEDLPNGDQVHLENQKGWDYALINLDHLFNKQKGPVKK